MATQDTSEIRVGANGDVYIAPVGTTAPTDATTALAGAWKKLGLISDEGVKKSVGKTVQDFYAWQLLDPARRQVTRRDIKYTFELLQWNVDTVQFGLDATISEGGGVFTVTPNDPEDLAEWAIAIDWHDGDIDYRAYAPRGNVSDDVEFQLARTELASLPIVFSVLGQAGVSAWKIFTDDANLDPTP